MTPLMPELHEALRGAAQRRARPLRRRRVPRRAGLCALLAVLAGGSALAATEWRPQLGDDHRGHPTVAVAGVPAGQVAALGILRRAQTDADRGPRVAAMLKLLVRHEAGGIHLDGVRLLAELPHGALMLIPMQRMGSHDPGYASSIRRDVLCVMDYTDRFGAGAVCGDTADLFAGRIAGAAGDVGVATSLNTADLLAGGRTMRFYQLVPDGVDRVDATLRDGSVHHLRVRDNAVDLQSSGLGGVGDIRTRWLDAGGAEVPKRVPSGD